MVEFDIFEMGGGYELIMFMLFAVFVVDTVSIVKCLRGGKEEITEYAELCIKYLKILLCLVAGAFFMYVALIKGYDAATTGIHAALGIMMLADAFVCLILKIRFTKKKKGK